MPQQLSPFTEVLYGWPYGSSGWNTGMDDNLLKFSFLFDKNIDSIVDDLPAPINGQAHYLTADNRIYFAVGTTYYSTPVPKHFILTLRSTGQAYQFNGTSLVQIDTPTQLDSRLDSIEVTVSSLGTAAYVNIEDLARQAELDIASAQAAAYTDTLRSDLSAGTGSSLVGFQQNGTGSTPRTVLDKGREVVSVKDFGAVGDGITDDTAAIQATIDYLNSLGGGCAILPAGQTFGITNTVFMKSNVKLVGLGRPKIKAIGNINGAMLQFGYTTGTIGPLQQPTNPCHNAEINGIEIDGNYNVSPVRYTSAIGTGVVYVWLYCKYNRVIGCDIHSAESGLVEVEDGADFFELRNCQIHDMISSSPATQYQNLVNVDGPQNAIIEGNDIYDLVISGYAPVAWGYGLRLHATDSAAVCNNRIVGGYHNILVDGRSNLIENNRLSGCTNSGIRLYQNEYYCRYNTVVGNFINANGHRGIAEDTGTIYVERNYIAFNTVMNSGDDNQYNSNNNSVVVGNTVFDSGGSLRAIVNKVYGNFEMGDATLSGKLSIGKTDVSSPSSADGNVFSGSWSPAVDNTNNVSSGVASGCRYFRVGNLVHVMGTVAFSVAATGAFELRLTLPISSAFANDYDAAGRHGDTYSVDGSVYALTGTVSVARLRLVGDASTTGTKTSRFTATYYIVP